MDDVLPRIVLLRIADSAPMSLSAASLPAAATAFLDGAGAIEASLADSVDAGGVEVSLDVLLSGGEAVFTGSVPTLTSANLAALFGGYGGVATPSDLPDLALTNLTVEVDTATEAFSVAGDVTIYGVAGSVLVSPVDRGSGRELPLGVGVSSTSLGDLPLGLSGAAADVTLPAVSFAYVDAASALEIAREDLTSAEQAFFDGRFGLSEDPDATVSLVNGLNLEADLPLSEVPAGVRDALGLDASGALLLEGSLALSGGAVSAASLHASLPGTPSVSGMPSWFQGDPGVPFELSVDYDGTVGTLWTRPAPAARRRNA